MKPSEDQMMRRRDQMVYKYCDKQESKNVNDEIEESTGIFQSHNWEIMRQKWLNVI